jgi:hypothetical protein
VFDEQTFLAVIGYLMSDVMCDAMVVERARYEDTHLKGEMQVHTNYLPTHLYTGIYVMYIGRHQHAHHIYTC